MQLNFRKTYSGVVLRLSSTIFAASLYWSVVTVLQSFQSQPCLASSAMRPGLPVRKSARFSG